MNSQPSQATDRSGLLDEVLTAYLKAVDAGEQPDRQELLAHHPDLAGELQEFFAEQDRLDGWTGPLWPVAQAARGEVAQTPRTEFTVADSTAAPAPGAPSMLGGYELLEEIGRGGMGVVYKARQRTPSRLVALKTVRAAELASAAEVQRFKNEADLVAALDHPHIVPVYEVGEAQGCLYFSMKLLEGGSLAQTIASGNWRTSDRKALRRAARLVARVAQAVHHAHQRGVLHRDLKPGNILLDAAGEPHVTDFGLAKRVEAPGSVTQSGVIVGTPGYMAPEQTSGQKGAVTTAADVYGLGAVLYALLTGRAPFAGENVLDTLVQVREREPERPGKINPRVDRDLETVCLKCLRKEPGGRYGSAAELAEDLERYLRGEAVQARRPTVWLRLAKWCGRHRPVVAGLVVGLMTLLVVGVVLGFGYQRRLAETERGVTAALAQAETLVEEGDKLIDHPERWRATARLALSALEKAEELLTAGVETRSLTRRVEQVRAAVDEAVADSGLLVELDRIRLEQAAVRDGHFDASGTAPLYEKVLGGYGVDLEAPERAAARVRDSRLREPLLAALMDWLRVSKNNGDRQRIERVVLAVDPTDVFLPRWREAAGRRDGTAFVKLVTELPTQRLPATTMCNLAIILESLEERAAAERLLKAAQKRMPWDFWLNHQLGMVILNQGQARAEEAVGYLRVALALRSESPGVHLNLGLALNDKGDLEGAISCYQAALRIDPNYADAHNNLGVALKHKGKVDEAIAAYHEAIRVNKNHASAHCNLGIALKEKGKLHQAITCFREAIRLNKQNPENHLNLGDALRSQGKWDDAIAAYREAIAVKEDFAPAHTNLGGALFQRGKLDEAIEELQKAIRLKKDDPTAFNNLGNALQEKGKLDQAIAAYREAIRLKKDNASAHNNLGSALSRQGRLDEAITCYQTAINIDPKIADAHYNLGIALKDKGKVDEAIACYKRAIAIDPNFANAHHNLGLALEDKGKVDEAIACYKRAIEIEPRNAGTQYELGLALNKKGKVDEAIACLKRAIQLDPKDAKAHGELGVAMRAKGDLAAAIECSKRAIDIDPKFAAAHYNLGVALRAQGKVDEAIECYRKAIQLDPKYAPAHNNLGAALAAQGKVDQAIECFKKAIEFDPTDFWGHLNLANGLRNTGKFVEALAHLRRGHELGSKDPRWPDRSGTWVKQLERLVELDAKLARVLKGEIQPADVAERWALAELCRMPCKALYAASVRFYTDAFAEQPKLADDLLRPRRYNAACAAALAGCGQGKDAAGLDETERARLRQQALDWLGANLDAWSGLLKKEPGKPRPFIVQRMQHWQADTDFAGVRGDALAKLPAAQRQAWRKLWADVAETLVRAKAQAAPGKKSGGK